MANKWWSECSKDEHYECLVWNRKVKWLKNGYEWGFISPAVYTKIKEALGRALDRIEERYGNYEEPYEEQLTLF